MGISVAVVGGGRMGSFLAGQLPAGVGRVIIDLNEDAARTLAEKVGGSYSTSLSAAACADIVAAALPAPAVAAAFKELAKVAKPGSIVLNMSTEAVIDDDFKMANPGAHFINAKIVGHAKSMQSGLPGYLILDTENTELIEKICSVMPGFSKIMPGDITLVPIANKIGSSEGIVAAISVRKKLREKGVPAEWADIVISTVCAGTIRSYVEGDIGEFARKLADELEGKS